MRNTIATLTRVLVIAGLILAPQMSFASGKDNDNGRGNNSNSSYGRDNYDNRGFDRDGYDHDGFDRRGYDRDGYDRNDRDARGHHRPGNHDHGMVVVCHQNPYHHEVSTTITVTRAEAANLIAHGDTLGPCAASGSH